MSICLKTRIPLINRGSSNFNKIRFVLFLLLLVTTWKIIPGLVVTMVIVSPQDLGVVGPLPHGHEHGIIHGGDPKYLQVLGAHPPSTHRIHGAGIFTYMKTPKINQMLVDMGVSKIGFFTPNHPF